METSWDPAPCRRTPPPHTIAWSFPTCVLLLSLLSPLILPGRHHLRLLFLGDPISACQDPLLL